MADRPRGHPGRGRGPPRLRPAPAARRWAPGRLSYRPRRALPRRVRGRHRVQLVRPGLVPALRVPHVDPADRRDLVRGRYVSRPRHDSPGSRPRPDRSGRRLERERGPRSTARPGPVAPGLHGPHLRGLRPGGLLHRVRSDAGPALPDDRTLRPRRGVSAPQGRDEVPALLALRRPRHAWWHHLHLGAPGRHPGGHDGLLPHGHPRRYPADPVHARADGHLRDLHGRLRDQGPDGSRSHVAA